jgi:pseudaminic acid cytidylyltransferase
MKIAVIPARGGSKRIPRKNIKLFSGKPIIARSIQVALNSNIFDKVIVSTDDRDIASIAEKYGAEVPFIRPNYLADDITGTNAVVKHAIQWFIDGGHEVEYACCIYATAPFLKKEYLQEGYNNLSKSNKLFAFSVASFISPIQRAVRITNKGHIQAFWPNNISKRSQDLDKSYHDAGQFYWGKAEAFINNIEMFSEASLPVVLPTYLTQDIDDMEDWKRAELMFQVLLSTGDIVD